jgi:putative Mg2+ transporter-C (MgtC) family protein
MILTGSVVFRAVIPPTLYGDGWHQAAELGLALLLSTAIGVEREIRQKNAGLRTHTLVGVGAALFMLISKYGFTDVVVPRLVVLDPSRVAAQVVTGVGFLGAGLIFVRRDSVRGLTTAAAIWVTAAVGSAAGAGLPILAILAAGIYFLVVLVFPLATRWLPRSATAVSALRVRYPDGHGILRDVLREATQRGFAINDVEAKALTTAPPAAAHDDPSGPRMVEVTLHVHGKRPIHDLAAGLSELENVRAVLATDANASDA